MKIPVWRLDNIKIANKEFGVIVVSPGHFRSVPTHFKSLTEAAAEARAQRLKAIDPRTVAIVLNHQKTQVLTIRTSAWASP